MAISMAARVLVPVGASNALISVKNTAAAAVDAVEFGAMFSRGAAAVPFSSSSSLRRKSAFLGCEVKLSSVGAVNVSHQRAVQAGKVTASASEMLRPNVAKENVSNLAIFIQSDARNPDLQLSCALLPEGIAFCFWSQRQNFRV